MRVIIEGKVTKAMIEASGFKATSYITNGLSTPPFSNVPTEVFPPCQKQPDYSRVLATHYAMANRAQALVMAGHNDHLHHLAKQYGLHIYAPDYHEQMLPGDQSEGLREPKSEEPDLFGGPAPDLFAGPPDEPNLFA